MQQRSPDGVRQERTGWRCQEISKCHRAWGFNCPAVDLDFVVAEYNHGKPVALVEYKERHARTPDLNHPTYRALTALADGYKDGSLPFLIAFYDAEDWWFGIIPVNDAAKKFYEGYDGETLSEQTFVRSLHLLRKDVLTANDEKAIDKLNTVVPIDL